MPAERTRMSRQNDGSDEESAWPTFFPSSMPTGDIAFAPNVTPGTFKDSPAPALEGASYDSPLFPPQDDCVAGRRSGHSKKKPVNHIPRPPNAFILFRSSFIKSQHVSTEVETNHSTLSKIIGLTWQNLPNEERQIWHARAKQAQDEHKRKFPLYAFKPIHNKPRGTAGEKRKVREVGPKDHKRCAKIAELLVNGKKGQELEVAIQEFDRNHVPEIVTRFEAPITANSYSSTVAADVERRSSTASPRASPAPRTRTKRNSSLSRLRSVFSPQEMHDDYLEDPCCTPAFEQIFSPQQSPSFDFPTFAFSNNNQLLSTFHGDELTRAASPLEPSFESHMNHNRPSLSINSNFIIADDWARCDSPISNSTGSMPTTPSALTVPFPESYSTFSSECASDYTLNNSYGDLAHYPVYSNIPESFNGGEEFGSNHGSSGYVPLGFETHDLKSPINHDVDFSTFMASLPAYSL